MKHFPSVTICAFDILNLQYSKTCIKRPLSKRQKIGFQYQLSLNTGRKYCRMLQGKHSAILSTIIKVPFVIKIFVLSIFERPSSTGFTVVVKMHFSNLSFALHTHLVINLMQHYPSVTVCAFEIILSRNMTFPTPAKPQISLRIRAV